MDVGHTYATPAGQRVMLYAEPSLTVPETIELTSSGRPVTFSRLAPDSIYCGPVAHVAGTCGNADCHRSPLGTCGCGRHPGALRFVRAVR